MLFYRQIDREGAKIPMLLEIMSLLNVQLKKKVLKIWLQIHFYSFNIGNLSISNYMDESAVIFFFISFYLKKNLR